MSPIRLTPMLALVCAGSLVAAEGAPEPSSDRSLYDVLGGASWSERRGEIIVGWSDLDVDGVDGDQGAWYLSVAASALSGYRTGKSKPFGGILGLGASVKTWMGNGDTDIFAIAPFAHAIAGGFADFSERTRLSLTGRAGPGLGWVTVDGDSDLGFAWNWAIEGTLAVTKGESAGVGVGLGYESVTLNDFTQEGPYILLTVGF